MVENAFWGIDGGRCVANFAVILYTLPTNWARELKKHTKVDVFPMPQSRRKGGGADLTKPTWRKAGSFPYSGFAGNGPAIYWWGRGVVPRPCEEDIVTGVVGWFLPTWKKCDHGADHHYAPHRPNYFMAG